MHKVKIAKSGRYAKVGYRGAKLLEGGGDLVVPGDGTQVECDEAAAEYLKSTFPEDFVIVQPRKRGGSGGKKSGSKSDGDDS